MYHRTIAALALLAAGALAGPDARAGQPLTLDARLANPVMQDGATTSTYLRVAVGGCQAEPTEDRTPVNVAFVIDRSGSMRGHRIAQAREAAIMAVNRLQEGDVASVVIFDQQVDVLVPAQPVADTELYSDLIEGVRARGSTALHAGVLTGAAEVRKHKDPGRLNRVILLSDGRANVGPKRPEAFAVLGRGLLAEGISVSTIGLGLGYNEDLLWMLARSSDGNHAFAREPSDLIEIFNREFDDVLASCAHTVSIDIELEPGVRALEALSRDGTVDGSRASFRLNQVYAATEHYVLLKVEVDREAAVAGERRLGTVKVRYTQDGGTETLSTAIRGRFTSSKAEIAAGADDKVAEAVVEQAVLARSRRAVTLQDEGKYEEARGLLRQNAKEIDAYNARVGKAPARFRALSRQYNALAAEPAPRSTDQAGRQRKVLRSLQAPASGSSTRY